MAPPDFASPPASANPRSLLSAAGRVSVSKSDGAQRSGPKLIQEKHRAYLASLHERNETSRQQKEAELLQKADVLKKEQGFSTHFSGANLNHIAKKKPPRRPSTGGRDNPSLPAGYVQGLQGCAWQENTVEIRGEGGEVYGIRPTGERLAAPESCHHSDEQDFWDDAATPVLADMPNDSVDLCATLKVPTNEQAMADSSAAVTAAREEALALLRQQRCAAATSTTSASQTVCRLSQGSTASTTTSPVVVGFGVDSSFDESPGTDSAALTPPPDDTTMGASTEIEGETTALEAVAELSSDLSGEMRRWQLQRAAAAVDAAAVDEEGTLLDEPFLESTILSNSKIEGSSPPKENSPGAITSYPTKQLAIVTSTAQEPEAVDVDEVLVEPEVLARRIFKLPAKWRTSLLRQLEEAEADVAASEFAEAVDLANATCAPRISSSSASGETRRTVREADVTAFAQAIAAATMSRPHSPATTPVNGRRQCLSRTTANLPKQEVDPGSPPMF